MHSKRLFKEIIRALSLTIDFDEGQRLNHAWRVALLAYNTAKFMKLPESEMLYYAGLLHDIGAIGLAPHINQHGPGMNIDPEARLHPGKGKLIIKSLEPLWPLLNIISNHHEYYDGSGFPDGIKGDDITIEASILTLVDLLEIDLSAYEEPADIKNDQVIIMAKKYSGTLCRPDVVSAFISLLGNEPDLIKSLWNEVSLRQQVYEFDYSPPGVEKISRIEMMTQLLWIFARIIDAKHSNTMGHSIRVTYYAYHIAKLLPGDSINRWDVIWAGLLHDVGKVGVPRDLLERKGSLTEKELLIIKKHAHDSIEIISSITDLAYLSYPAASHHERYDGLGYPFGKSGENIPLLGRILMYANSYDALTSNRSHRKSLSHEGTINMIKGGVGLQFDPNIADVALEVLQKHGNHSMALPETINDFYDLFDISLTDAEILQNKDTLGKSRIVDSGHGILLIEANQWSHAVVSKDFTMLNLENTFVKLMDGLQPSNFIDCINKDERKKLVRAAEDLGLNEYFTQFFFTINNKYIEIFLINRDESYDVFCRTAEHRLNSLKQITLFFKNFLTSSDAVFFTDPDGIIFDVNETFLNLYGFKIEEVLDKDPRALISLRIGQGPHTKMWEYFNEQKISSWNGELVTRKKNGENVVVSFTIDSIRDSSGRLTGYVGHALDITDRKRAQEELLKKDRQMEVKNAELERLNQLKNDLMAITSHDLKSPLSTMVSYALLAKEKLDEGKVKKLEKYLDCIAESGYMMGQFISEMLDLEKIDSGNFELNYSKVYLDEVLLTCIDSNRPTALRKGINIVAHIQKNTTPVSADIIRMEQVFHNLLSNAVKFSPEGSTIEVYYTIEKREKALIKICDQGPGIPEDDLEAIFERYYQIKKDGLGVKRSMGTGLGLYIVATILALHEGNVQAKNRKEGGSLFSVELPCSVKGHEFNGFMAMILDPPGVIMESLKAPLSHKGIESVVVSNIYEAKRIYNYEKPNLIFANYESLGKEEIKFLKSTLKGAEKSPVITAICGTHAEVKDALFSRTFLSPVLHTEVCEFLEEVLIEKSK